jgi:hypothetical protein
MGWNPFSRPEIHSFYVAHTGTRHRFVLRSGRQQTFICLTTRVEKPRRNDVILEDLASLRCEMIVLRMLSPDGRREQRDQMAHGVPIVPPASLTDTTNVLNLDTFIHGKAPEITTWPIVRD